MIGGPSNSIIRNRGASRCGYAPEKRITLVEGEGRVSQRFHLREPTKLTMLERGVLVRQIEEFVKFCEETYSTVRLLYVEMTPKHTDRCCSDREHMGEDDVWVLDNQRVEFKSGYESSGLEKEPELAQIRKMGVVSEDGVHLTDVYCGNILP